MTFKIGDRVMLKREVFRYPDLPSGAVGTVVCHSLDGVGVRFDCHQNRFFNNGRFYLHSDELTAVEGYFDGARVPNPVTDALTYYARTIQENANLTSRAVISRSDLVAVIDDLNEKKEETPMNTMYTEKNCRVAGVTLEPYHSKEYAYALFLKDVETGAKVVVRNSDGSLVIGTLVSVDKHPHEKVKNGCEVICVIDMAEYNKRQEQFDKMTKLRKKMDARVKALQDIALYEMLAKDDPELKDLLAEFKSLGA